MKTRLVVALAVIASTSFAFVSNASAQEKTRAEVRQELIQAENNGSRFVTDTSYPAVNPIFAQQVARLQQQNQSGEGPAMSGSSAAGKRVADSAPHASNGNTECVGPAGFCVPFFGS
ncbi:DUF4148 domain-containing protein [Paraburkholderia sp.]|uniref:DUF4148 domain-containing protein n=1 Tax=Paraburkholderia sp. TaxID=1926495 RepID=UPI00239EA158|nr:DUF4148 domain-containing protein [Paraburkholderia sp.]MDE1184249.1 DUF4148 domain-containing protein [Paraburkholderia sp.]